MFYSKKALQSYILILIIVSILMGLFLSIILTQIYGEDNVTCKQIKYEVSNACKKDNSIAFDVKNDYLNPIEYKVNGKRDITKYLVDSKKIRKFYVSTKDNSVVHITPLIKESNKIFECRGKVKSINSEVLIKCQKK